MMENVKRRQSQKNYILNQTPGIRLKKDVVVKEVLRDMKIQFRSLFHGHEWAKGFKKWTMEQWIERIRSFLFDMGFYNPSDKEVMGVMILVRRKVLMRNFSYSERAYKEGLEGQKAVFYDIMKNPTK
jgi:hypothetical protein